MAEVLRAVNGKPVSGAVDWRACLSGFLRGGLRLTGTHVGCDIGRCGWIAIRKPAIPSRSSRASMRVLHTEYGDVLLRPNRRQTPPPTEAEVRADLVGDLCRCTGNYNIVKAIMAASGHSKDLEVAA